MTLESKLKHIVREHIPCTRDVEVELRDFFYEDYTVVLLSGDGVVAYTKHDDAYWIWFVYTDGKLSNAKKVYNVARELAKVKPVLYTGIKDHYANNSTEISNGVYKIKIGE